MNEEQQAALTAHLQSLDDDALEAARVKFENFALRMGASFELPAPPRSKWVRGPIYPVPIMLSNEGCMDVVEYIEKLQADKALQKQIESKKSEEKTA